MGVKGEVRLGQWGERCENKFNLNFRVQQAFMESFSKGGSVMSRVEAAAEKSCPCIDFRPDGSMSRSSA